MTREELEAMTAEDVARFMYRADPVVRKIRPHLAGLGDDMQGWVLAELVSIWLGGHHIMDSKKATDEAREKLLDVLIKTTRALIPCNETKVPTECPSKIKNS
jgi:hypothetical protein